MKYQIMCDDYYLYDIRDEELTVINPKLSFEKNKVSGLNFTIYNNHPYYDKIEKIKSVIKVYQNNKLIFKGKCIDDEQNFNNAKKIECDGILGYLNDVIIRPFEFSGTPEELFQNLITKYNNQVQPDKQFIIGTCTVTDNDVTNTNNQITRSSTKYMGVFDCLKEKLFDSSLGGYLFVNFNDKEQPIIHYLSDSDYTNVQKIEFGKNLLDIINKNNASEMYNAILPIGATVKDKDAEGNEIEGSEHVITIESIPDEEQDDLVKTKDYVYSKSAVEKMGGIRFVPASESLWNDVTLPTNLYSKAKQSLLNKFVKLSNTLEVTTLDLAYADNEVPSLSFLQYVEIISKPHNVNKTYLLTKATIDIQNPQNTKLILGDTNLSLTDFTMGNKQQTNNIITRVENIEKDYVTNDKISTVVEEKIQSSTSIKQTAQEIVMAALEEYVKTDDYSKFTETIQSQLGITHDELMMMINSNTTKIDDNSSGLKTVEEKQAELKLTLENFNISFKSMSEKLEDMNYNFNTDALTIAKSTDPVNSRLDNSGIKVYNYTDLQAVFNNKGSGIKDLIVTETAQIGYLKFMKSEKNNKKITSIYHVENLVSRLEDLE